MINTLSNAYGKISLVVKAPYCTRACGTRVIRALTTRDILPYMFDNSILLYDAQIIREFGHRMRKKLLWKL